MFSHRHQPQEIILSLNKFRHVRRGTEAYSPDAGRCEMAGYNVITIPFGCVAINNLVMTPELDTALHARRAKDGVIPLVVYDAAHNAYAVIIETDQSF